MVHVKIGWFLSGFALHFRGVLQCKDPWAASGSMNVFGVFLASSGC